MDIPSEGLIGVGTLQYVIPLPTQKVVCRVFCHVHFRHGDAFFRKNDNEMIHFALKKQTRREWMLWVDDEYSWEQMCYVNGRTRLYGNFNSFHTF